MTKRLAEKQQGFADLYEGNATQAAEMAGYKHPKDAGSRCLKNVEICRLIQERRQGEIQPEIASRIDRQMFWTKIIRDESLPMRERLKASELLGKSEGDFLNKVAVEGDVDIDLKSKLRAEIEREMVKETFERIEQQNRERDPDDPCLI